MKLKLDESDLKILQHLQKDARSSISVLAHLVGLSRPAVAERIEKLERAGIIKGYTAVIKGDGVENPIVAFIAARHRGLLTGKAEQAVYELSRKKEVLEVHGVAGEDCLYIKVRVKDMQDMNRLVRELQQPPLLMETRTTIAMNTYFEKAGGILIQDRAKEKNP
ncbi:MAG TPA: Lrp/AsnC family transcriptional regulator [Acidobacteriota bacterium]|nr:Lrp/AsnC family transcriptional regulator [Acidobacteriota bacterium]